MTNTYTPTEEYLRASYIDAEQRRNTYHGKTYDQTDEELGEEFDRGMAKIKADAIREVSDTLAMHSTAPTRWIRDTQDLFNKAAHDLEKGV